MKKLLLLFAILTSFCSVFAQQKMVWSKKNINNVNENSKIRTTSYSERQVLFTLDLVEFQKSLLLAPDKFSGKQGVEVVLPNIDNQMERFEVWENSNFEPQLQAQNPSIRAYIGKSKDQLGSTINFSVSPFGVQTFVMRPDTGAEFIEPYTKDNSIYILFDSKTRQNKLPINCTTAERELVEDLTDEVGKVNRSDDQNYRTMRLALSCVGEYGVAHGGTFTSVLAAMNATMTRVNGVFEKDIALHLNIISNNNLVMYYNPNTDPYSGGAAGSGGAWNGELETTLVNVLGVSSYDIGHLFGQSGGGGNAGCIGCVCSADGSKGSGFTSPQDGISQGDNFDIDYVVHEMGHQLGSLHIFSHGGISGSESSLVSVEPGSGSSIMGYAGITSWDVQAHSDAYFGYRNIRQMQLNLVSKTCPVTTPITNSPPVVNAGDDKIIPKGTPFILKGIASDAENDNMTYCWEQNNNANSTVLQANSVVSPTKTVGPNFRSRMPSLSPDRYMPKLSTVLANNITADWESLNTVARSYKFTFTARDNNPTGQQTKSDEVLVTVNGTAGPFTVTSQSTQEGWTAGSTKTVSWNIAGTDVAPISTSTVTIKFSTDGGLTFPHILAAGTPNDGSETITVPSLPASQTCRLMVEADGNIYYAVNSTNILLGYSVTTECTTYNYSGAAFTVPDGVNSNTVKQINVPASGVVSDVNVTINATHPNIQNLIIAMTKAGGGGVFTLFNQQCMNSANMNVTFDAQGTPLTCASPTSGTYIPPTGANLNALNVNVPAGNWSFAFKDVVAGNVGTINSIALEVCQNVVVLANEEFSFHDLAIYPNPNSGEFTVQFASNSSNKVGVEVVDLRGRKIFENQYANSGLFNQTIQLDNAASGIYLVSITDGDKKIVKKIVVE